jgi:hypothetical protein
LGSSGSQNDSKTKQSPQLEQPKETPPTGADKFLELFVKTAKKNRFVSRHHGLSLRGKVVLDSKQAATSSLVFIIQINNLD